MAEYGVKQSPAVIPSWMDMQPEGDFIQSLYREKLPEAVDFYMFYGFRGDRNPFNSNNDGTIDLASLLDRRSQAEASMAYAFDEDHASIIYSKVVVDQYNAIINTHYARHRALHQSPGGYVKVNFSFDYQANGARPWPHLILRADGKEENETVIKLSPTDSGKTLGPFPSGRYDVRLTADSVKTAKKWVPISIKPDSANEVDFVFTPDGTVSGYVTKNVKPGDRSAGMPSWVNRPEDNTVDVQSITLAGNGIRRTLDACLDADWKEKNVARQDFCVKGYLHFFNLPAGKYELAIQARGYQPHIREIEVRPGTEGAFNFIHMVSEK